MVSPHSFPTPFIPMLPSMTYVDNHEVDAVMSMMVYPLPEGTFNIDCVRA